MKQLVYDRQRATYYNAEDLNRVEEWTKFLADRLLEYGYQVPVKTKKWDAEKFPYLEEINRIRKNVDALQTAFYKLPDWRRVTYTITLHYSQANAMEWDLHIILLWLERMVSSFHYAGEAFSEEGVFA